MAFGGAALRFAGTKLLPFLSGGLKGPELAMRLAPDALGGLMVGAMTPGDLGDKVIAGATDATFGAVGGLATGNLAKRMKAGETVQFLADMGGSYGGAFGGMYAGDALLRGKDMVTGGKGQTPYEKLSDEQQALLEDKLREEILAGYGLALPGVRPEYLGTDSYLQQLGLG